MIRRYESVIIDVITRINVPLIRLFGLYVITHGHYSPGGGFQGGVILAVSVILQRLALTPEESHRRFPPRTGLVLASVGVLIFGLTGLLPALLGGAFLDYGALPIPGLSEAARHYWGILIVEVGIGIGVCGALVAIFDKLTGVEF
jgi:multicomponent Na+:H+ antiporter subunit B